MKLKLNRPIVFFDIESTGLDIAMDRIVELCLIKVYPDGSEEAHTMRFNPGKPISPEASQITGICDADVADCPPFKEKAASVAKLLENSDIAGFNSNAFDIPLLVEEFIRAGINFDIHKCKFVDVQNIYHKLERRTLSAAYKFYCNKDLENAHSALADTRATYEVLMAQLDMYPDDLQNDIAYLSEFSRRNRNVDFAGRVVYNEQGQEVINFGKYKGQLVADVFKRDPGYFSWVMQGDFTQNTKQVFMKIRLREK